MAISWVTPRDWTTGEKLTAAIANAHIRDNFDALGEPWTAITPTYTNFTIGNGTVAAAWRQVGKTVDFRGKVTLGTTSSVTGTLRVTLPANHIIGTFGYPIAGMCELFDTSGSARRYWNAVCNSATDIYFASETDSRANATNPWASWATGDTFAWDIRYETA